jgi:hypothetical protein
MANARYVYSALMANDFQQKEKNGHEVGVGETDIGMAMVVVVVGIGVGGFVVDTFVDGVAHVVGVVVVVNGVVVHDAADSTSVGVQYNRVVEESYGVGQQELQMDRVGQEAYGQE